MKKISKKFMTFESFKKNGQQIEDMQDVLETWCNSEQCIEVLGCKPEDVGYPDGEEDGDGETYNVWVGVTVDKTNYDRIKLELDKNYAIFIKAFTQFAVTNNCNHQVLTNDDSNEITFELNFFI